MILRRCRADTPCLRARFHACTLMRRFRPEVGLTAGRGKDDPPNAPFLPSVYWLTGGDCDGRFVGRFRRSDVRRAVSDRVQSVRKSDRPGRLPRCEPPRSNRLFHDVSTSRRQLGSGCRSSPPNNGPTLCATYLSYARQRQHRGKDLFQGATDIADKPSWTARRGRLNVRSPKVFAAFLSPHSNDADSLRSWTRSAAIRSLMRCVAASAQLRTPLSL